MKNTPVFRAEALAHRRTRVEGSVVFLRPVTLPVFSAAALLFTATLLACAAYGTFTNRATVSGALIPEAGIARVYTPAMGIVVKRHFEENAQVTPGQALYTINNSRYTSSQVDVEQSLLERADSRIRSSRQELDSIDRLRNNESQTHLRRLVLLRAQLDALRQQLAMQTQQIKIAASLKQRYGDLLERGYITRDMLNEKESFALEQQAKQAALERERDAINAEIVASEGESISGSHRLQAQREQAERNLLLAQQDAIELDSKREYVIKAPVGGIATGVQPEVGQAVDGSRPLVTIVPVGGKLLAELYIPRQAIGFIAVGNNVNLQYEAYKYQQFGLHRGTVASISPTAIPAAEIAVALGGIPRKNAGLIAESYYRVLVELNAQSIDAYGKRHTLKPGMTVSAEIDLETKNIYEWLFDPILSSNGRISSFFQ